MAVATEQPVSGSNRLTTGAVLNDAWSFLLDVGRARLIDAEQVQDTDRVNDFTDTRTGQASMNSPAQMTIGQVVGSPVFLLLGAGALVWFMTR